MSFVVKDNHFAYLRLQKGSLDNLSGDHVAWLAAYNEALAADFETMKPFLPKTCSGVLDIGSGLGGIDNMIAKAYGPDCGVCLLDGVDDPPVMTLHHHHYNNMEVAQDFHAANGVTRFDYYDPDDLGEPRPFDLIVSLGSWCFHYAPSLYLDFVLQCTHKDTVLILDVRSDRPEWSDDLRKLFRYEVGALSRPKFTRMVFHARAN